MQVGRVRRDRVVRTHTRVCLARRQRSAASSRGAAGTLSVDRWFPAQERGACKEGAGDVSLTLIGVGHADSMGFIVRASRCACAMCPRRRRSEARDAAQRRVMVRGPTLPRSHRSPHLPPPPSGRAPRKGGCSATACDEGRGRKYPRAQAPHDARSDATMHLSGALVPRPRSECQALSKALHRGPNGPLTRGRPTGEALLDARSMRDVPSYPRVNW